MKKLSEKEKRNITISEDTPGVQRCSQGPIAMAAESGTTSQLGQRTDMCIVQEPGTEDQCQRASSRKKNDWTRVRWEREAPQCRCKNGPGVGYQEQNKLQSQAESASDVASVSLTEAYVSRNNHHGNDNNAILEEATLRRMVHQGRSEFQIMLTELVLPHRAFHGTCVCHCPVDAVPLPITPPSSSPQHNRETNPNT